MIVVELLLFGYFLFTFVGSLEWALDLYQPMSYLGAAFVMLLMICATGSTVPMEAP